MGAVTRLMQSIGIVKKSNIATSAAEEDLTEEEKKKLLESQRLKAISSSNLFGTGGEVQEQNTKNTLFGN